MRDATSAELSRRVERAAGSRRYYYIRLLNRRPDAGVHLARLLREGEAPIRRDVLAGMRAREGEDLAAALAELMESEDPEVRRRSAERLGEWRDPLPPRAAEALDDAARGDPSSRVRAAASAATGRLERRFEDVPEVRVPERPLLRSWYSDPTLDAGSEIYTFRGDGTGDVEDFHMGFTREAARFRYEEDDGRITFWFDGSSGPARTRYRIEPFHYEHPLEGMLPALRLTFEKEPYFTDAGPPEGAEYFGLLDGGRGRDLR